MLHGIVAHLVTNLVVQIVHQPAFLNGQNLVEGACNVESDCGYILQALTLVVWQGLNLLLSKVSLVGATKVEFVAILLGMHRTHDGAELWQLNLSDASKLVFHLLLFELNLLLVWQVLPLTTTANTEVSAEWGRAYITIFAESNNFALGKRVLLAANLYIAYIAGHAEWNKHHHVVPMEQAFAFSGNCLYHNTLKEW